MIDSIARALLRPEKASIEPAKAVTGPGAAVMSWGLPLSQATNSAQQMMKDAQVVYSRGNRWVKRAEMTISSRVGSVPWHLETDDGKTITDESSPELRRYRDLFEKPLGSEEFARQYPSQPSTRRSQWGITSRHAGLCNVSFWHLDEIDAAAGFPVRLFQIRPDRMTPREQGGSLIGWTLDAEARGGGTDLSLEEVLPFYLDQPDRGHFGTGLVESILGTLGLPSAIDRHAIDTLSSGGRLAGIYSPKEASGDDVFDRLVSDLRVIKEMPDASKRDVVARAPIEFHPTSADMNSLTVGGLSQMSRDDTLTHWGVPLSTIGGYGPGGLNSGESRKYDEAALWQNAVQFRVDMLYETIQYRLLDRLQVIGLNIQLVIDTPSFDDDSPKYDMAVKAQSMPLRNVERRALLGLDPFGDPVLDDAIWMPVNVVEMVPGVPVAPVVAPVIEAEVVEAPTTWSPADATAIGRLTRAGVPIEDAVRQLGLPPLTPAQAGKARLTPIAGLRRQIDALHPRLKKDLAAFLEAQKRDLSSKVQANAGHLGKKPSDTTKWWNQSEWDKRLAKVLAPYASQIADMTAKRTSSTLGTGKAAFTDLTGNAVLKRLLSRLGTRIKGINETTREKVSAAIREGIEAGDGAAQLGDRVEASAGFDEYRAELIARTESARVLNESQIETFREYGVTQVRAIDGDDDEECAARNGQEFDLDEAMEIEDHPNGTLDWSPIVGSNA